MQVLFLQKRASKAGAQVCLAALVRALRSQGVEAQVLLGEQGWLAEELRAQNALAGIVPFPSWRSPVAKWLRLPAFALFTHRLAKSSNRPQLLHANDLWEALVTEWLARRWQRPWILHLRTVATSQQLAKYHASRANAVLVVSPSLGLDLPLERRHYLPDGLAAFEFFSLVRNRSDFPRRLGVMGHEAPAKGWEDLGQALRLVQEAGGPLPTEIVFFGQARPAARHRLRHLFPGAIRLTFLGQLETELPRLWRQLDLIIIPSRQESFGRSALETIAAGVPVLASRTGIIPWLMGTDSPWTFPPANPQALAAAWQSLPTIWDDRHNYLKNWRQQLRAEFGLEKIAQQLRQIYSKILADHP